MGFMDGVQTLANIIIRIYLVLWATIFCEVVVTIVVWVKDGLLLQLIPSGHVSPSSHKGL
jgi:hypothetical protein